MNDVNWFLLEVEAAHKRSIQVLAQLLFMANHSGDDEALEESGVLFSDLTGLTTAMFPDDKQLMPETLSRMVLALVGLYRSYGLLFAIETGRNCRN